MPFKTRSTSGSFWLCNSDSYTRHYTVLTFHVLPGAREWCINVWVVQSWEQWWTDYKLVKVVSPKMSGSGTKCLPLVAFCVWYILHCYQIHHVPYYRSKKAGTNYCFHYILRELPTFVDHSTIQWTGLLCWQISLIIWREHPITSLNLVHYETHTEINWLDGHSSFDLAWCQIITMACYAYSCIIHFPLYYWSLLFQFYFLAILRIQASYWNSRLYV